MPQHDIESQVQQFQTLAQSPVVPQNPFAQFGAALGGFTGNQPMEMFQKQREQALQEQFKGLQLGLQVQTLREKRESAVDDVLKAAAASPNRAIRAYAIPQLAKRIEKQTGQPLPPALQTQLLEQPFTGEELKSFYLDINSKAFRPEVLMQKYQVSRADFDQHAEAAASEAYRKLLGLDPIESEGERALKLEKARLESLERQYGIRPNTVQAMYAAQMAQALGRPLHDITDPQALKKIAENSRALELQDEEDKEARLRQRQVDLIFQQEQIRIGAEARKPLSKEAATVAVSTAAMAQGIGELDTLAARETFKAHLGPRAYYLNTAREKFGWDVEPEWLQGRTALAVTRDYLFFLLTGANVTAADQVRFKEQLPDLATHPNVFATQLAQTKKNITFLEEAYRKVLMPSGPPQARPGSPLTPPSTRRDRLKQRGYGAR